jgi:hypothetical protein
MTDINSKSSRRSFFLHGGAVLGAGVATTAGAAALVSDSPKSGPEDLQRQLASHDDREAIRQLQLTFTTAMQDQDYEAVAQLFSDDAPLHLSGLSAAGRLDILGRLVDQYRAQQAMQMHSAYRLTGAQRQDLITLAGDGLRAAATFHTEVQISTPLRGDSTAAQMARLQGQTESRRWEAGRFEAQYLKIQGQWKMASLRYSPRPDFSMARPG